jgi:hypothetical protein
MSIRKMKEMKAKAKCKGSSSCGRREAMLYKVYVTGRYRKKYKGR